jgi:hypothetical protein
MAVPSNIHICEQLLHGKFGTLLRQALPRLAGSTMRRNLTVVVFSFPQGKPRGKKSLYAQ